MNISSARAEASRRNGRVGKGPRTAAGKARSAGNARRHGLNTPIAFDPRLAAEMTELAHRIAGDSAGRDLLICAARIAEAQLELGRVRQARRALFAQLVSARAFGLRVVRVTHNSLTAETPDYGAELALLERYERRAFSSRNSAVHAFDRLRAAAAPAAGSPGETAWLRFGETNPSGPMS
jgi:hypothetical protein